MNNETKNLSIASLVVVLGFPPMILYQMNKHILLRSLDSLHFIFFQLVFFFAYHHLLGIPSLSTTVINYLSRKTLRQSNNNNNNNNNNNTRSIKSSKRQVNNNDDESTHSRQISSAQNSTQSSTKTSTQTSPQILVQNSARNSFVRASKYKYSKITSELLKTILDFVDVKNDPSWNLIYEDNETDIKVYQNPQVSDFCYKVTGTMENTPETTFDLLADVKRRYEWDSMTDEAGIIETIDESTKFQYIKMKSIFPTSARDIVTIGYTTQLEDGRLIMVNRSMKHRQCPEKPGILRLEAGCAGVVVVPIKDHPNKCFVTQIVDADLKGWIPKSVITLMATRDIPASIKKLNRLLAKMPSLSVSKILTNTPFIQKVPIRSSSSVSVSSSSSSLSLPSLRNYHKKSSSFSGRSSVENGSGTDIHSYLSEGFLSDEKENNNNRSIDKRFPNVSFWKSFIQTILFFGGNSSQSGSTGSLNNTSRFIIAAFAYSVVLIAGIKKLRNRNVV